MGKALAVTITVAVGAMALWMAAHSSSRTASGPLRAQTVEIIDQSGYVRLRMGVTSEGTPSVRLYDSGGTRRLELAVSTDGPTVTMFDGMGHPRQMLTMSPGLEPSTEDAEAGP